jgi:hypothetical protein
MRTNKHKKGSKQILPCGNGKQKVNKSYIIYTNPSLTPVRRGVVSYMGRQEGAQDREFPVQLKWRITTATPSTLVFALATSAEQ